MLSAWLIERATNFIAHIKTAAASTSDIFYSVVSPQLSQAGFYVSVGGLFAPLAFKCLLIRDDDQSYNCDLSQIITIL